MSMKNQLFQKDDLVFHKGKSRKIYRVDTYYRVEIEGEKGFDCMDLVWPEAEGYMIAQNPNEYKKARPILFSTDMVKAILQGRKTQTRRIVKMLDGSLADEGDISTHEDGSFHRVMDFSKTYPQWQERKCPYGEIGDILWVRETWATATEIREKYVYKADFSEEKLKNRQASGHRWKPSIHMPRAAARLFLEIEDIDSHDP